MTVTIRKLLSGIAVAGFLLAVSNLATADAYGPEDGGVSPWRIAGEAGIGLLGGALTGACVAIPVALAWRSEDTGLGSLQEKVFAGAVAGVAAYPLGVSGGVCLVGGETGSSSVGNTAGYSYLGLVAGWAVGEGLSLVGRWTGAESDFVTIRILLLAAGPIASAVAGYNWNSNREQAFGPLGARLELPQLTMRYETPDEVPGFVVYDARLVTVKLQTAR